MQDEEEDFEDKESQLEVQDFPGGDAEDGELNVGPPNEDQPPVIFRQSSYERRFLSWVHDLYELTDEPGNVKNSPTSLDPARPQHEYSMPTYISDTDDEGMPVTIAPFPKGNKIFLQKLTSDGDLIGEMTLEPEPDGETWRVSFINVRKKYRGKGYAKELHDAADEWAKANNTWIAPDYDITDSARSIWHKKRISPGYAKEPYQRKKPQSLRTHLDPLDVEDGEEYEFLDPTSEEDIPTELKYRYRRADHFHNIPSMKEIYDLKRKNQELPEPSHKDILPSLSTSEASDVITTFHYWFSVAKDMGLIDSSEDTEGANWPNKTTKPITVSVDQLVASQDMTAGPSRSLGMPIVFPRGDNFIILNGHHRIVNGIINGQTEFQVRSLLPFAELQKRRPKQQPSQQSRDKIAGKCPKSIMDNEIQGRNT